MGDAYVWSGPATGSWGSASNWADLTTGQNPAAAPPGASDSVTINSAAQVSGTGAAASLTINAVTGFTGQISTGALTLNANLGLFSGASLTDSGTATLTASVSADGGSFTAAGTVTSSPTVWAFTSELGGSVQVGGLDEVNAFVDGTSTFEVGSAHAAVAGEFLIDSGATVNAVDCLIVASTIVNNGAVTGGDLQANASFTNDGTITDPGLSQPLFLTVDAGGVFTNDGIVTVADVFFAQCLIQATTIVNGNSIDDNGNLILNGRVTGTGQINVGMDAQLLVNGDIGAGQTINLTGEGVSLVLGNNTLSTIEGSIVGFDSSDTLVVPRTVTSATWDAGVLTLLDGQASIENLDLAGEYAGIDFITAFASGGAVTQITESGTATADSYLWSGPSVGSWNVAANWTDQTQGQNPAVVAPGVNDSVTINGVTNAIQLISGRGASSSLTISGPTAFAGQFSTGALTLNANLTLHPGASLTDSGTATLTASVSADGGSFTAAGTVTSSPTVWAFTAEFGGSVLVGGLGGVNVYVDGTSTFEVGLANDTSAPVAGEFLVAPGGVDDEDCLISATTIVNYGVMVGGHLVAITSFTNNEAITDSRLALPLTIQVLGAGGVFTNNGAITVSSPEGGDTIQATTIVNDGISITDNSDLTLDGAVTGTGQINVGANAQLVVNGDIGAGQAINLGAGASLQLTGALNATLTVPAGDSVTDSGAAAVLGASVSVDGGAFAAAGTVTSSPLVWAFAAEFGGSVQAGGLYEVNAYVDGASTFEVGFAHAAIAGEFLIDPGATVDAIDCLIGAATIVNNGADTGGHFEAASAFTNNGTFTDPAPALPLFLQVLDAGGVFTNNGVITAANVVAYDTIQATTIVNANTLDDNAYLTLNGQVAGTGQINLGANAQLVVNGDVGAGQTINLAGEDASLVLGASTLSTIEGSVTGFDASDALIVPVAVTSANWSAGVLTLLNGATVVGTVNLTGAYGGDSFLATANGGDTEITLSVPSHQASTAAVQGAEWSLMSGDVGEGHDPFAMHSTEGATVGSEWLFH